METLWPVIILAVVVVGFAGLYFLIQKSIGKGSEDKKDDQSMLMLQNQLNEMQKMMHTRLDSTHQSLQNQFASSSKIITDVTEKLTKVEETTKQVLGFAGQLQSLENILKNPKERGILGEYYLETLLQNVLPPGSFKMQYAFKDGEIVDAAVFVKDKVIPVDSKFSLENYNRLITEQNEAEKERLEKLFVNDLKNRILETSKYIRPNEGTMDFAFMFIPHEAIYYDLLINKVGAVTDDTENLIQRAAGKYRVIIVSPTSFLAYLQTVLQGLRALQIEEQAVSIRKNVEKLQKHLIDYEGHMQKMGNQLGTVVGTYNVAYKSFNMLDKDVVKITGVENEVEVMEIDKPI